MDGCGMGNGKCSERIVPQSMTGPVLEGLSDFEEEVVGAYLGAQRLSIYLKPVRKASTISGEF